MKSVFSSWSPTDTSDIKPDRHGRLFLKKYAECHKRYEVCWSMLKYAGLHKSRSIHQRINATNETHHGMEATKYKYHIK